MANVEMKTLTIGENTYEIVDEIARSGVEALETNKDMSSYSTLLEYVLANPFSRAYYKGYGLEDCILGNSWGTIITLSPQSGAGVLVFAFRNNDTHTYMRKTHYYNSVEEWNGDWLDITEMSERIDELATNVLGQGYITDADAATSEIGIANGWSSEKANFPEEFTASFGVLITSWVYRTSIGDMTSQRAQCLLWEGNIAYRFYNGGWDEWFINKLHATPMELKTDLGVDANQVAVLNTDDKYVMHFYKDGIWLRALHIDEITNLHNWKTLSVTDVFSDLLDYSSAEVKQLGKRIYANIVFTGSITTTGANAIYIATIKSAYSPGFRQMYGTRINANNQTGQVYAPATYTLAPSDNKIYLIPVSVGTFGNSSYPWGGTSGICFMWDIA